MNKDSSDEAARLTYWQALALMLVGLKLAGAVEWHWACVLIPHYMLLIAWAIPPTIRAFEKTIREMVEKRAKQEKAK